MKWLCRLFGHRFNEFHCYEVVCSRCRICRAYTEEDERNLQKKIQRMNRKRYGG